MKPTIATGVDREQASRLVDLAWKEFTDSTGQTERQAPELRQALLWLAWQACRIEREAQEEIRKIAVEESARKCGQDCVVLINAAVESEREACAKIADGEAELCEWYMVYFAEGIAEQIRARSEEKEAKKK